MMHGAGSSLGVLTSLVGADVITTDPVTLAPFEVDQRRLFHGKALALARPRDAAQIATILAYCNAQKIGVVPVGGNTSYCGGATPDESGSQLVLSLARMNRIRAIDPDNNSLTADAGCVLAAVQQAAASAERYFPLSLGAEGSCQLGGNLATNAGGLNVVRYGMARDLVLGLEVVLPDGRILESLGALRKDNTGYDLKSLFVGSEGTLGIISAASVKLFPAQRGFTTALTTVASPNAALTLLGMVRGRCGESLSSFELMPRVAVELAGQQLPSLAMVAPAGAGDWLVLLETTTGQVDDGAEIPLHNILAGAHDSGLLQDVLLAQNSQQRDRFWQLREAIPEAQRLAGASLKHDISVPISRLPRFIERAVPIIESLIPEGYLIAYGHLGDGNLHFNVQQRPGANRGAFLARESTLKRAVHDLVQEFDGSFSAEHGIGRLKVDELAHYASTIKMDLMRAIKRGFDPNGIMNPGKVLRV